MIHTDIHITLADDPPTLRRTWVSAAVTEARGGSADDPTILVFCTQDLLVSGTRDEIRAWSHRLWSAAETAHNAYRREGRDEIRFDDGRPVTEPAAVEPTPTVEVAPTTIAS